MNSFREQRLAELAQAIYPDHLAMPATPKTVVHMLPSNAYYHSTHWDNSQLREHLRCGPGVHSSEGVLRDISNGVMRYDETPGSHGVDAYLVLRHNGILEVVDARSLAANSAEHTLSLANLASELEQMLPQWLQALETLGAAAPLTVLVSLLDVEGYSVHDVTPTRSASPTAGRLSGFSQRIVKAAPVELPSFTLADSAATARTLAEELERAATPLAGRVDPAEPVQPDARM